MTRETGRTPRQVFGAMLRYHREQASLSRPDLARQVNKSVSLIQAIELGQRAAPPKSPPTSNTPSPPTVPCAASARRSTKELPPD